MNPNLLDGGLTGIFIGDYLQSITPSLSLGLNAMWQRAAMNQGPETMVSYAARYKTREWVGSARLVAAGGLQCSYWRRLAERVEAGVDVNLQFQPGLGLAPGMMGGPMKKEGTTTLGVKYDFRQSSFRGQVDSQGRLACLLEKRIAPAVSVSFFGEIDHVKVGKIHFHPHILKLISMAVRLQARPRSLHRERPRRSPRDARTTSGRRYGSSTILISRSLNPKIAFRGFFFNTSVLPPFLRSGSS